MIDGLVIGILYGAHPEGEYVYQMGDGEKMVAVIFTVMIGFAMIGLFLHLIAQVDQEHQRKIARAKRKRKNKKWRW